MEEDYTRYDIIFSEPKHSEPELIKGKPSFDRSITITYWNLSNDISFRCMKSYLDKSWHWRVLTIKR